MPDVLSPAELAAALRSQRCPTDRAFDHLLPEPLRVVSHEYWTPLHVAVRAACWFEEVGVRSVVDIGSGVGKFCVAAALASTCSFVGLEQRGRLVDVARSLVDAFELGERVDFLVGTLGEIRVPDADAYYFFNPFGENLFFDGHLDKDVELGDERYDRDVAAAESLLRHVPLGTYVLTYNDFGGMMPPTYRLLRTDRHLPRDLCLWRKVDWPQRVA
jgi:SAM-dependent methyltransferase